jgi:hypothetical protein
MVKNGNNRVPERQRDVSECKRDVLGNCWLFICFVDLGGKSYPRAVHNFCKPETRVHISPVFVL